MRRYFLLVVVTVVALYAIVLSPSTMAWRSQEPPVENDDLDISALADFFLVQLSNTKGFGEDLRVTSLRVDGDWVAGGVVDGNTESAGGHGDRFFAHYENRNWKIYLEGTTELRRVLADIPETLISSDLRELLDYQNPDSSTPRHLVTVTGYKLPWPAGITYTVTRAWCDTSCPHTSTLGCNAVDVGMPRGSTIVAMKGGVVGAVVQGYDHCGCNDALNPNYVRIDHTDGTKAYYLHIGKNQALVSQGQQVSQGQPIARADLVGYTCGTGQTCPTGTCVPGNGTCNPFSHLHFHVHNSAGVRMYIEFDDIAGGRLNCGPATSGNGTGACCGCAIAASSTRLSTSMDARVQHLMTVRPTQAAANAQLDHADDATAGPDASDIRTVIGPRSLSDEPNLQGLRIDAQDATLNTNEWQTIATWRRDLIPPVGSLIAEPNGEAAYALNVALAINAGDKSSWVSGMRFSADGKTWSEWEPYARWKQWQLDDTTQVQTVYAQIMDEAGNVSKTMQASVRANLDLAQPSSPNYTLARSVLGMGGGNKTSSGYLVRGTSGQLLASGLTQSTSYRAASGFWAGIAMRPCYDFGGQLGVDVYDISVVASSWGATIGSPNYNPLYDANSDGRIDIVDVMTVAAAWGTVC